MYCFAYFDQHYIFLLEIACRLHDVQKSHTICIIHNYILQLQHAKNSQNTDVDENSQNILNLIKDTSKATSGNCTKCDITFLYCSNSTRMCKYNENGENIMHRPVQYVLHCVNVM